MERTGEFALFRASPDPDNGAIVFTFGQPAPAIMDSAGVLWVRGVINTGGPGGGNVSQSFIDGTTDNYPFPFDPSFNAVTQGSMTYGYDEDFDSWDRVRVGSNAADAMTTQTLGVLRTVSTMWGFNGTTYDRIRSGGNNADNVVVTTMGNLNVRGFNYIWDAAGSNWDRWTGAVTATFSGTTGDNADSVAVVTTGNIRTNAENYGFNGTSWDRLRSGGNNADGLTTLALGVLAMLGFNYSFDGSTWSRLRIANASQFGNAVQGGIQAVAKPGEWSQFDGPAANTAAVTTKAAVAGARHVVTSLNASVIIPDGGSSIARSLLLRDGAAGVGPILGAWNFYRGGESPSVQQINLPGLNIIGSVNTAMTFQMAAPGANCTVLLNMTGYTV